MTKIKLLNEEIKKAKMADGFLIMITRLNNGKLNHFWVTQNFPRNDFVPSLEKHKQLLKSEMPPTTAKTIEVPDKDKKLPPEYRPESLNTTHKKKQTVKARMK